MKATIPLLMALFLLVLPAVAEGGPDRKGGPVTKRDDVAALGVAGARYPHVSPDGKQIAFGLHGDLWVVPVEGGRATRLTLNESNDLKPVWSPDGKHLAFTSDRSGSFDLWTMPADGGVPTQITFDGAMDHVCQFAPDGDSIVFQSTRTGSWRIFSVPVKGGTPLPLTRTSGVSASLAKDGTVFYQSSASDTIRKGYRGSANDDLYRGKPGEIPTQLTKNDQNDREPHVTPDGGKVYFLRETGKSSKDFNLHVLDVGTGDIKALTSLGDLGMTYLSFNGDFTKAYFVYKFRIHTLDLTNPKAKPVLVPVKIVEDTRRKPVVERTSSSGAESLDISRDGARIAIELGGGIWVMDSHGGQARQLTPTGSGDHAPRFSPDGGRVAFYSEGRTGNADLFVVNVDGSGLRQLTFDKKGDFFQNWSPDGTYLVFCSERSGNKEIWRLNLDGSGARQLTRTPFNDDDPSVSPDGKLVAYDSWERGRADIYVMNPDGSGRRRVYGTIAVEESPRFSPDSRMLVFTRTTTTGISASRQVVVTDLEGSGEVLVGRGHNGVFTPDGKEILYLDSNGRIKVAAAPSDIDGGRTIPFLATQSVAQSEQFARAFDDAWDKVSKNFYDPKFHGVDWKALRAKYRPLAVGARTRLEFYNFVRLMLGELNASHQGISGPISDLTPFATGSLACELIPEVFDMPGGRGKKALRLRVVEPDKGGPADKAWIRDGDYVFGVGKRRLGPDDNFSQLLRDTVGKEVVLIVGTQADGSDIRQVKVTPETTATARQRKYGQSVMDSKRTTGKQSGGKVAYIHIPRMNGRALQQFQAELGSSSVQRAKALVLDVRNNGGGNIHQQLIDILSRRHYANNTSRTRRPSRSPTLYWDRPIVLLINERSFSDAEVFGHAFKTLKLGTIVGVPTPGAVIGTRDVMLVDGSRFRVTLSGFYNLDGTDQEGNGCVPDVIVAMTPKDLIEGNDPQLSKAIQIALEKIAPKKPAPKPTPKKPETPKVEPKEPEAKTPAKPPVTKPAPKPGTATPIAKPTQPESKPAEPKPEKPVPEKPKPGTKPVPGPGGEKPGAE